MFLLHSKFASFRSLSILYSLKYKIGRVSPKLILYSGQIQDKRSLYSAYSLGLEGFQHQSAKFRKDVGDMKEIFLKKMQNICDSSDKNQIVYTEDLRKLIAFCEEDKEYIDLALTLLKRYFAQTPTFAIKPFLFGPVMMRLFYLHNLTDKAVDLLLNEDLSQYINEDASFQVAMDLCYEKKHYETVLKLMKLMKSLPKSCVTLALGANYHISTDESLKNSLEIFQRFNETKQKPTFHMVGFIGALALDREKPEIALEICASASSPNHYLINNLRILAKARLGHLNEVLPILQSKTLIDLPKLSSQRVKGIFAFDVIEEIEQRVRDKQDLELLSTFMSVKKSIEDMDLINEQSLKESIGAPLIDNLEDTLPYKSKKSPKTWRQGNHFRQDRKNMFSRREVWNDDQETDRY